MHILRRFRISYLSGRSWWNQCCRLLCRQIRWSLLGLFKRLSLLSWLRRSVWSRIRRSKHSGFWRPKRRWLRGFVRRRLRGSWLVHFRLCPSCRSLVIFLSRFLLKLLLIWAILIQLYLRAPLLIKLCLRAPLLIKLYLWTRLPI